MVLKAGDTISGREGKAFASIDGTVYELFEIKNFEAKVKKNKAEFKSIGSRATQYKTTSWTGTGTMTIYYVTSRWAELMLKYMNEGKDIYFKLVVTNEDETSNTGAQEIALLDCNIDEVSLAKLDADAEFLDESVNFTFSGAQILKSFTELGTPEDETPKDETPKDETPETK